MSDDSNRQWKGRDESRPYKRDCQCNAIGILLVGATFMAPLTEAAP
jgi:hypothetical protein